ncbi:MAG TPA: mannitol dehydrogenase family protein [Clostridiaceae bacterium]|jgi:fructuronate reductase|nr:mannitol dehydrogenase family protein [Clostridiaceae bacterium]
MLKLNREGIKNRSEWYKAGIELPEFDIDSMISKTFESPTWIHFGAGNIFRGFIAVLQQTLLNKGLDDKGIIAAETFDVEIIDKAYKPFDNLSLLVIMNPDGSFEKKVVGSLAGSLAGDPSRKEDWNTLNELFKKPSLQMVSMTITEKGYNLKNLSGEYFPDVKKDIEEGPASVRHAMSKMASLAYTRFKNGKHKLAFVSMDNCSHNGERFGNAVITIASEWAKRGLVEPEFLDYVKNPDMVSFPWTMIDKITPRPAEEVRQSLIKDGLLDMELVKTEKNTYVAPFINAEGPQYLVVEDCFPNGRPPLQEAGVIFTSRETVDRVEKMKVCTCLNPLHTSLAIYGCLLGYKFISEEMKDPQLKKLVEKICFEEGMPVVVNPGVIDPVVFANEVIKVRLPNPYIPDTPQRIAVDTSQKLAIRFGETIKSYEKRSDLDTQSLKYIPLVIAGWCRYLMGLDDEGNEMQLSPDPMLDTLRPFFKDMKLGAQVNVKEVLSPILSNPTLFGVNLYEVGLGEKTEGYFGEMITGPGAVRKTLEKYVK